MKKMRNKIKSALYFATELNLWLTFRANLHYVGWIKTLKMPFLVYKDTKVTAWGGVEICGILKPGLVTIGGGGIGTLDFKNERTVWDNRGRIIFKGKAAFGKGARVSVDEKGVLEIGDGFHLSGRSSIICNYRIIFGNNLLLSWDILIMDTDFHPIYDEEQRILNEPREVVIGNHVWIGCRSMILKGVVICDDVIIAAGSTVTRNIDKPHCIYSHRGDNSRLIRGNISWSDTGFI